MTCKVSDRRILIVPTLCALSIGLQITFSGSLRSEPVPVGQPRQLKENIFYREGDISKSQCNQGWILLRDYAIVIDAGFPDAATELLKQVKESAGMRPIRYLFDTTTSEDHSFGNEVWGAQGATILASEPCRSWLTTEGSEVFTALSATRPDVKASKLRVPDMGFSKSLVLDDGTMRIEMMYFGHAHNASDAIAFLPKQKVLFTGDICVNGPFNFLKEAEVGKWIDVLNDLMKLDVEIVAPGHGPTGDKSLLAGQRHFLVTLREKVRSGIATKKKLDDLKNQIRIDDPKLATWVGPGLPMQIEAVFQRMDKGKRLTR